MAAFLIFPASLPAIGQNAPETKRAILFHYLEAQIPKGSTEQEAVGVLRKINATIEDVSEERLDAIVADNKADETFRVSVFMTDGRVTGILIANKTPPKGSN